MTKTTEIPQTSLRELQIELREKTAALFAKNKLVHNWALLFLHDNKQFKGRAIDLSNYRNGRSTPSPETLALLTEWVTKNAIKA